MNQAATPCDVRCRKTFNSRSVVRRTGKAISGRSINEESRCDGVRRFAEEHSLNAATRTERFFDKPHASTPTKPFSVGSRRAGLRETP